MNTKPSTIRGRPTRTAGALLGMFVVCGLSVAGRAQYTVYSVEFNQTTNRFGTMNLLNGCFSQITNLGSTVISDIAWCPTNGAMYGIRKSGAKLVTFDKVTGAVTTLGTLSVSGIQSLAFRPSDGALFGATQSKLYRVDPANAQATLVGSYGSARNLGSSGQNIRFAQDGNLYVSNTSSNTDIYRISTQNGTAVWVGELPGFANLVLENGGQYMYGVGIAIGAPGGTRQQLLAFDIASFVTGGTNLNGSAHSISYNMVGAGPRFAMNFNFSGNVANQVPNYSPTCTLCVVPQPDHSALVKGAGIVGQDYTLQVSSDLIQWTNVGTITADATASFSYLDSAAKNYSSRFYRTLAQGL